MRGSTLSSTHLLKPQSARVAAYEATHLLGHPVDVVLPLQVGRIPVGPQHLPAVGSQMALQGVSHLQGDRKEAGGQAGGQAGRNAGRQAGRQAGRKAGRQAAGGGGGGCLGGVRQ